MGDNSIAVTRRTIDRDETRTLIRGADEDTDTSPKCRGTHVLLPTSSRGDPLFMHVFAIQEKNGGLHSFERIEEAGG